jgi:hypothetical protein
LVQETQGGIHRTVSEIIHVSEPEIGPSPIRIGHSIHKEFEIVPRDEMAVVEPPSALSGELHLPGDAGVLEEIREPIELPQIPQVFRPK